MKNSMQPSEWNYNETEGHFMVLLIAQLSLVIYNAIMQSYTKSEIKDVGLWVGWEFEC